MRTESRKTQRRRCIACGGGMRRAKRERTWTVAGTEYGISIPAWACTKCDEVLLDGPSLVRAELTVATRIANDGPVNGETFRFLRKVLPLRASELGQILDVRAETLSHWETGHSPTPLAEWMLVSALVLDKAGGGNAVRERLDAVAAARKRNTRVALTLLSIAGLAAAVARGRRST